MQQTNEVTTWAMSAVSQTVVYEILKGWGAEGYDAHLRALQLRYTKSRDLLQLAAEKQLGSGKAADPLLGMPSVNPWR